MKKVIPVFILVGLITTYSINIAYAGFGGGARGGTFGTGGFSTSTVSTKVTYQTLSDLAQDLNAQIAQGKFDNIPPFSLTTTIKFACTIGTYSTSDNPLRYVIYVTYQGSKYYYKNDSGGLIYAYAPTDDPNGLKPILDKLKDIYNYYTTTLTTKLNNIISYIDGIEGYVDGIEGYVDGVENKLDSIITNTNNGNSTLGNILNVVRKNYYFGYKSDANNVDYPIIPISWDTANNICSYLNNNFNHDGTINYISVNNQVGTQYTFYHARVAASGYIVVNVLEGGTAHDFVVCDRNHNCYMASDDTSYDHISNSLTTIIGYIDGIENTLNTISSRINTTNTRLNEVKSILTQIAGNTDEDIYVTLYTTDSNGNSYSTVSYRPEIIDGIVSYINTHLANKPLKVLYRDGQDGQVADVVRNMMFVDFTPTGYVRLRVMWNNNSYGYAYLSSPSHVLVKQDNTYVDDTTFMNTIVNAINNITIDDTNIVDAIDRIYEWLDNADLSTNETIVQVVQDYSNDVDNSVDWASKILDLFRDVFVFDRPAPSFSGILSYFYSLGRDAE